MFQGASWKEPLMDVSAVGIATNWAQAQAAQTGQAVEIAMLRQQAQAERSLVALLETAVEAGKAPPPAPDGQGQAVDLLV
jgi:hypothetical protein